MNFFLSHIGSLVLLNLLDGKYCCNFLVQWIKGDWPWENFFSVFIANCHKANIWTPAIHLEVLVCQKHAKIQTINTEKTNSWNQSVACHLRHNLRGTDLIWLFQCLLPTILLWKMQELCQTTFQAICDATDTFHSQNGQDKDISESTIA